jgi:hypothetical protein
MPEPSEAMKRAMGERRIYLYKRHNICTRMINKLEPLVSAIDKDEYNYRNTQLSQVFRERVAEAKEERKAITELHDYGDRFSNEYYELRSIGR